MEAFLREGYETHFFSDVQAVVSYGTAEEVSSRLKIVY